MKKILVVAAIVVAACWVMVMGEAPHRYFVGKTEVGRDFWASIPDSVRAQGISGEWDYDTLLISTLSLPIAYYVDSIGGEYTLRRRSDEDIARLEAEVRRISRESSEKAYRLRKGDKVPNFSVVKNPGGAVVEDVLKPGKCYLINFWATWCGNCLLELRPDELPRLAERYIDDKDFVFLPICIDSSLAALRTFFHSERGEAWSHLEYVTTLDTDRTANGIFAEAGHLPLTVVVGRDGRIAYIRIGRITTEAQYAELEAAIDAGLAAH